MTEHEVTMTSNPVHLHRRGGWPCRPKLHFKWSFGESGIILLCCMFRWGDKEVGLGWVMLQPRAHKPRGPQQSLGSPWWQVSPVTQHPSMPSLPPRGHHHLVHVRYHGNHNMQHLLLPQTKKWCVIYTLNCNCHVQKQELCLRDMKCTSLMHDCHICQFWIPVEPSKQHYNFKH